MWIHVFSDFHLGFNCFERIAHHKAIKIAFKENPIDINNAQEIVNRDIREKIIERFFLWMRVRGCAQLLEIFLYEQSGC